jgi:hypothetical protein
MDKQAIKDAILAALDEYEAGRVEGETLSQIRIQLGLVALSGTQFRKAVGSLASKGELGLLRSSWGSGIVLTKGGRGITKHV